MDFIKKTLQVGASKYSARIFDVATNIIIVRSLGPRDYGIYTIAFLIPAIISSLGSFNLGPSLIYHLNRKKIPLSSLFSFAFITGSVLGFIYYISFYSMIDGVQTFYLKNKVSSDFLAISMVYVPIILIQKYTRALLRGLYRIAEFTLSTDLLPAVLRLILTVLVIYIFKSGLDGIIWVPIITQAVVVFAVVGALWSEVRVGFREGDLFVNSAEIRSIIKFGTKGHIGGVVQKSNDQIAMIIMTGIMEPSVVGFFSLASKLAQITTGITGSITTVLVPKVAMSSLREINSFFPRLSRVLFFSLLCCGACVAVAVPFFVKIAYGSDFSLIIVACWLLIPGFVFLAIVRISNTMFTQTGMPLVKSLTRSVGLIVNVILLMILLPKLKLNGAAIALTMSYLGMFSLSLCLMRWRLRVCLNEILVLNSSDLGYLFRNIRNIFTPAPSGSESANDLTLNNPSE